MSYILSLLNKAAFIIAPVFWQVVYMAITFSVAAMVFIAICRIFADKIPPGAKGAVWGVMLAFLIMPLPLRMPNPVSVMGWAGEIPQTSYRGEYDRVEQEFFMAMQDKTVPVEQIEILEEKTNRRYAKSLVFDVALPLLWAAGVALCLACNGYGVVNLKRKIKTQAISGEEFTPAFKKRKAMLGSKTKAKVVVAPFVNSPAVFGLIRPVILLPEYTKSLEEEKQEYILLHETGHIKGGDLWVNGFICLMCCVYWFIPKIFRIIRNDMEAANDSYVIRILEKDSINAYSKTLVRVLAQSVKVKNVPGLISMAGEKNNMEKRIKLIKQADFFKKYRFVLGTLAAVLAIALAMMFFTSPAGSIDIKIDSAVEKVLFEKETFEYYNGENFESLTLEKVPVLFDNNDLTVKIQGITSVNLDRTGKNEVVLSVFGTAGDTGGRLILHSINHKVYGYKTDSRMLVDLKTDGSYSYFDPTGANEGGTELINSFTETGFVTEKIATATGDNTGFDSFTVNGGHATEKEYLEAVEKQTQKENATWYNWGEMLFDNIKSGVEKLVTIEVEDIMVTGELFDLDIIYDTGFVRENLDDRRISRMFIIDKTMLTVDNTLRSNRTQTPRDLVESFLSGAPFEKYSGVQWVNINGLDIAYAVSTMDMGENGVLGQGFYAFKVSDDYMVWGMINTTDPQEADLPTVFRAVFRDVQLKTKAGATVLEITGGADEQKGKTAITYGQTAAGDVFSFKMSALNENWQMDMVPRDFDLWRTNGESYDLPLSDLTPVVLINAKEGQTKTPVGYIAYRDYTPYTDEIAPEKYHETVWPSLRLSSFYNWGDFTSVKRDERCEAGVANIYYKDRKDIENHPGAMRSVNGLESLGVLAYNKDLQVYAAVAFAPDTVTFEQAREIAKSIEIIKRKN